MKIQLRGNCQCCSRQQAVVKGKMSKHGYTVDHGWFNGVCLGNNHSPMQVDRSVTDIIIKTVREEVVVLNKTVENLKNGKTFPVVAVSGYEWVEVSGRRKQVPKEIPFNDASIYEKEAAIMAMIWRTEQRAKAGKNFADDMEAIINEVHGKPLIEVKAEDGPAPIRSGDKKVTENGVVLTCKYQDGARVYWNKTRDDGKVFTGWTGSQAWRKLVNAS